MFSIVFKPYLSIMLKNLVIAIAICFVTVFAGCTDATAQVQPQVNETKQLEYSLDAFSKKIVAKNKIMNLQYKRYGKQAILTFDIIKPNEVMLMLYMLEYNHGGWSISKEYHYSKTVVPMAACT